MNIESSRRGFIGGAAAFFVVGCKTGGWLAGRPRLRFGVVSDIHVTTQASCAMTERAFRYFKSRGADAVMIPGDLTDWGLKSGFKYIKSVWDKVFSGTDVVPLFCGEKPYDFASRAAASVAPEFPSGAKLRIDTRNTENRSGKWVIVMNCEFPSAVPPAGGRVFDYEIRIVPKDGSKPMAKKFLSPAYSRMAKYEPKGQRFWFDVAELPQDVDYVVEVRAFNCFGKESRPLVSGVWHSVPGLDKVKKEG